MKTRKLIRFSLRPALSALALLVCFFIGLDSAFAADITLRWDANTEPDLAGYKVFWGTASGVYSSSVDVGNVTTKTLTGLLNNTAYFFTVVAYDSSGNQSNYATQVSWSNDTVAPNPPQNLRKAN